MQKLWLGKKNIGRNQCLHKKITSSWKCWKRDCQVPLVWWEGHEIVCGLRSVVLRSMKHCMLQFKLMHLSTNVYISKFHFVAPHPQSTNSTCRQWLKNEKTKRKIEMFHKSLWFNKCGLLQFQWSFIKPIFNPLLMSDWLLEVVEIIMWWSLVQRFRI
jgi:hypothetical protein